ncbi:unnamed protein product [Cylicostephanus goldi]|uniref:Major facilitator superfamily (MFS) profile domain-containing protein n=1 Tax=Cylicostephanus goldi TaxID=71465 RepID=A0A3P7N397_CYLGO|nr:unnamed protein product [Cylicostephanus goldi]
MMVQENVDNSNPAPGESNDGNVEIAVSETQPLLISADTDASKTTFSSFSSREWGILVMLASANLLSVVAYSCIAPFYPKEAKTKGLSDFEIGLTFGIFELVIFLGSPIAGKLGILQTCGGIGFSLGPFLGGMLYDLGGFRLPFYSLGMAMFCIAFLSRLLIPADLGRMPYSCCSTRLNAPRYRLLWRMAAPRSCRGPGCGVPSFASPFAPGPLLKRELKLA